jgi:hypothetical protein
VTPQSPRSSAAGDAARGYRLVLDADETALLDLVRPGRREPSCGTPDWQVVSRLARVHRLQPRLHRATTGEHDLPGIPAPLREDWRREYFSALSAAVALLDQRDRAVGALAARGVRPMVVKGAALGGVLYPDPAVRPMGDIDLLLPRGALARLVDLPGLLRAAGVDAGPFEIEEDHHDLTMDGILPIDLEAIWQAAVPASFAPEAALVPCLEDQLLLTAVSCCRNSFWNLVLVLDAAEMLRQHRDRIDVDRLAERARAWQLEWALDTLLGLAEALFGEAAPAALRARLEPPALRRRMLGNLLAGYRLHPGEGLEALNIPRPAGAFALKYAVSHTGIVARQARAFVFPSWKWMRAHFPADSRAGLVGRYVAHPFVLAGLGVRLVRARSRKR